MSAFRMISTALGLDVLKFGTHSMTSVKAFPPFLIVVALSVTVEHSGAIGIKA